MTANRPLRLSREELASCWAALDLGEPPYLLQLGGLPGLTVAEAQRRAGVVLAEMAQRGLSDGVGPVPALAERLRLFARPEYRLDIRFPGSDGRPVLGLGAVSGAHALALVGVESSGTDSGGPVNLLALDSTRVIGALLGLLGEIRPGRGNSVNVPADLLAQAVTMTRDNSFWSLADQLKTRGIPPVEAASLARMCTGVTFGGTLGASAMFDGQQRRGDWVIGFQRTNSGYFMNLRKDDTVTLCPTDGPRLAQHWRDLLDSLRRTPAHR